jgi:hypothetical protein
VEQPITLTEALTVSGVVTSNGRPAAGALVALSEAAGAQVDSARCDPDGCYSFHLPALGPYVLTAYDPNTSRARARKTTFTLESVVVDIPMGADYMFTGRE